jgi:2-amino-4-hydroxy-6-hydroxymethyldihydropteridine diphosphokinase
LRQSRIIETPPWGVVDQPRFLNQVIEVAWTGTPRQLLTIAKKVELEGGRVPAERWGPRVIDVDILLFGDERIQEGGLVIPHPRIAERPFVMRSLRELGVKSPDQAGRALVKR